MSINLSITPAQIEALSFDELRELIQLCLEHLTREHVAMLAEAEVFAFAGAMS